jgi:hypothetical protein
MAFRVTLVRALAAAGQITAARGELLALRAVVGDSSWVATALAALETGTAVSIPSAPLGILGRPDGRDDLPLRIEEIARGIFDECGRALYLAHALDFAAMNAPAKPNESPR